MDRVQAFVRRFAPLLILIAGIVWIIVIVLLILGDPKPGGGSPV